MSWKLSTLNCNGIRSATSKGLHAWRLREDPDVVCLQELRMQEPDMGAAHLQPEGWLRVQSDAEKKGYSGTAVWSRLQPALGQSVGCGLDWADREGRVARLDLPVATVVSVYLPSGSSGEERQAQKEAFMEHFLEWSRALLATGRPAVLCGDLNIAHTAKDIKNAKGNQKNSGFLPHERAWFDRLLALGWVDVYRRLHPQAEDYTWWSQRGAARSKDVGWRLDYQLASPGLAARARSARIEPRETLLSDHAPVTVEYAD
jgi:exodeoxyribonuclease III